MTRTIVLDAGAVIAAERNDPALVALVKSARLRDAIVLIPAGVLAETWRGPSTNPRVARLLKTVDDFPPLDADCAKRIGTLLGATRSASPVDASVAEVALRYAPSLVATSDPADIRALLQHAPRGAVSIYTI